MTGPLPPPLLPTLPESHRAAAAALYWQAFGGKLGRVLGPDARARRYLERVIRPDHALAVIEGDQLVGLAGFKSPDGGFADGSWADMRAVYGAPGAVWRMALLRLMTREVDNRRFLIDGICVAAGAHGRGVGARLVTGLQAEAARRGYPALRLEVVDTNLRARALYQRLGFVELRRDDLGLLRHVFGFGAAITMICVLDPPP